MNNIQNNLNVSRRNLLKFGAGVVGTAALTVGLGSQVNWFNEKPARADNNMTPDEALNQLLEGNKRFIENKRKNPNQSMARIEEVAQGQAPFAAILSCADSRVPSEIIFDQGFGDLFVVRNAGNVATPEEIGSLEFGTLVLGAKVLMVIGHKNCGAVKATIDGKAVPGQIASILDVIQPAINQNKTLEENIISNVKLGMNRLQASPVISQLIKDGKLKIVGGYYDLDTGKINVVA
ncbi:MAG: carbonic anhydrase [Planktothrix sp.]|uniref:carbonic anhydrase n=1 Tax=Planktothrix sp. TaxID=3088171 RepID=UPI0038D413CE